MSKTHQVMNCISLVYLLNLFHETGRWLILLVSSVMGRLR